MDFWRSGRARSSREDQAAEARKSAGVVHRIRHMYFPPWVPVVGIIVLVFGILGLLFVTRSATGAPRIGEDHWHATYTFYACGEKQPNAPEWSAGVHTHGDGVVHIHPFTSSEEGAGARLVKWFDYGGGSLTGSEIRLPGTSKTWKNGDTCPDGTEGEVQVFVNSQKLDDWSRYLPKDGDRIRMVFGPPEEVTQLDDRIVIPEEQATREIEVEVSGNEATTAFSPASLQMRAGETVKLILRNAAEVSHGMRIAGSDGEYETGDDFVIVPEGSDPEKAELGDIIEPGQSGFAIIRFDEAGEIEFKDPTANDPATGDPFTTGTIIVAEAASPTPTGAPEEQADEEIGMSAQDGVFDPAALTFVAGRRYALVIKNDGQFVHNVRIAGPDGQFETDDDIVSEDIDPGQTDRIIVVIDQPGSNNYRDDFRPTIQTGVITVQ
jgi:uncharacterized cupredoxin-like copper-binding protein